jgi:hypothetical protein
LDDDEAARAVSADSLAASITRLAYPGDYLTNFIQASATLVLGVIGLRLAHNYRRQIRAALVLRTAEAFARLWALTGNGQLAVDGYMDELARKSTAAGMRNWYFEAGDGLYLSAANRTLFFKVLEGLEDSGSINPRSNKERLARLTAIDRDRSLGCICWRQLSLLRTQLKSDLAVYDEETSFALLRADEKELLGECAIREPRMYLRRRRSTRLTMSRCTCSSCPV